MGEMAQRLFSILCAVLYEAHRRQVQQTMETLSEGQKSSTQEWPGGFTGAPDMSHAPRPEERPAER